MFKNFYNKGVKGLVDIVYMYTNVFVNRTFFNIHCNDEKYFYASTFFQKVKNIECTYK